MIFAHLSDLHLGKRLCEAPLLADQHYILQQILDLLDASPVDGVLLALAVACALFPAVMHHLAGSRAPDWLILGAAGALICMAAALLPPVRRALYL